VKEFKLMNICHYINYHT